MSMKVWEISLTIQGNCTIPWHTYCTSTVKILPLLASCKHWKIQSLKMYVRFSLSFPLCEVYNEQDCQKQDQIECVVHIYLAEIPSLIN